MAAPPAKRAKLSVSSQHSSASERQLELTLGRSNVARQPVDMEENGEGKGSSEHSETSDLTCKLADSLFDRTNEADMTQMSSISNGNYDRSITGSVPPSQRSRFFVNCDTASSDRIDNGFLTPQSATPEKQNPKLVITSPGHLSTLKDNNAVLRSHNFSLATQNRYLREANASLAKGEKRKAQTDQVDITNPQTQVHNWTEQISALQDQNNRLQHENRLFSECGLEWARREAMVLSQNDTLRKRVDQLMANRRAIVEQYQRMKAELDVARHVMAGVDAAAGLSFDASVGQNASDAGGQEYLEL